ncbi:hypothetical protein [Cysteiniphilum litorale]|uniref:hypothetical protein n=1 Tax=Cysteiniphilum litorale TaxID=2056700 RepID=UPI003F8808FB
MINKNLNQLSLNLIDVKVALPLFTHDRCTSNACIVKLESGLIVNAVYWYDETRDLPNSWFEYNALNNEQYEDIHFYKNKVTHWQYADISNQVDISDWIEFKEAMPVVNTEIVIMGGVLTSQIVYTENTDLYGYDYWSISPQSNSEISL